MANNISVLLNLLHRPKARRYILIGSTTVVLISVVQPTFVGSIFSEAEAIKLVESLQQSSLYLGGSIAGVSATVLALMLTLLSMTNKVDSNFEKSVYRGIEAVGLISTITFVGAIFLLLFLSLPVGEFDNIPSGWFTGIYYILCTLNGCLSGLMVVGVLILFDTIRTLIKQLSP